MKTTTTTQRQPHQPSSGSNRHVKTTSAVKNPAVRTTEIKKMIQIVLTDPNSVTREEFMLLQSAIGYRQTAGLMEEGKRRQRLEKLGQTHMGAKTPSHTELQQDTKMEKKEKQENGISKSAEEGIKQHKEEIRPKAHQIEVEGIQKQVSKPDESSKNKSVQDNLEKAKAAAAVPNKEKQSAPHLVDIGSITDVSGTKKEASKAPEVKIKMGDPGSILEQLVDAPPTQALNAYSQASVMSGEAMDKQKEETQKTIPQIPAPTGLSPVKGNSKAKKRTEPAKHAGITSFKSEKTGGKIYEGMPGAFNVGSSNEPDPEDIMAEAREYSASAPGISMTGEADPSQMEAFKAEASQNVQAAKQEELSQINRDFGENSIFPKEDHTILKAKHPLKAREPKISKINKKLDIPVDMEAQLNKTLGPSFKDEIGEQKNEYQRGKEKFDIDAAAARADSDTQIKQLKSESKNKQMKEQAAAKDEVNRLRGQWRDEINVAVAEYDQQADAETKSKTREISNIKEEKEKEVKNRMVKAEKDADNEYKTAKKKADEKEKEKEKEKEDKPWYEKAWNWVKDKAEKFVEGIKKAINFIYDGLRKAVKIIFELAKAAITGIIELGRKLIVGIIKGLGTFLKGLVKAVFAKFPGISKKICGLIDKAVDKAVSVVNDAADFLKKGVSEVLDFLANTLDKLLGAIQSLYNGIFTLIGMLISGKFAEIMQGIASLIEAAKASFSHIEGELWKQLIGQDISKPLGQEDGIAIPVEEAAGAVNTANEKLTEDDIEVDHVETGEINPELMEDMNLKDGEVRHIQGSSEPYTMESIMCEFDLGKEAEKTGNSFVDGVKMRTQNGGKILDQIKEFVIKWFKDNWVKLLLGILGALAGIVVLQIVTGGAITVALPTIISIITNIMNAAAVVSIVDTIAKAAGYIEAFLSQGWIGQTTVAAMALATAIAMGLVELVMYLGFKAVGAGLKAAGKGIKQGIGAAAKGVKNLTQAAGRGIKSLLKSGVNLVSRTGSIIIQNGKLIIRNLQKGFSKGVKKLKDLIDRLLSRFKFKRFELEYKDEYVWLYGVFNPWRLLAKWKHKDKMGSKDSTTGVGGGNRKVFADKPVSWTATRPKGTQQTYKVYQRNDINWDL
ncbi:MAG: hypothetical protein ACOYWZ_07795, partial [Bacillota bacterium]